MKSANADEIFGFASGEIKSTRPPSRRISPNEVGFHRRRRFHPTERVDLVESAKFLTKLGAFWCGRQDSNLHGHPLEPKSNVSANSTTPACIELKVEIVKLKENHFQLSTFNFQFCSTILSSLRSGVKGRNCFEGGRVCRRFRTILGKK